MKNYFYTLIAVLFLFTSCQNSATKDQSSADTDAVEVVEFVPVELVNFTDKAGDLVGQQIVLVGTIDHVCKHGGQKMFLVNTDTDARVKIVTGENMAAFNTELEGENVEVVGVVDELRIDEEYLREWEEEILAGLGPEEGEKAEKVHMGEGEGEHHEDEENADMKQINAYRTQIAESGKDYISFFSVVCVEYKIDDKASEEGV